MRFLFSCLQPFQSLELTSHSVQKMARKTLIKRISWGPAVFQALKTKWGKDFKLRQLFLRSHTVLDLEGSLEITLSPVPFHRRGNGPRVVNVMPEDTQPGKDHEGLGPRSSALCSRALFVVVQSFSCVWLFVNPWTAAWQASLSFTVSQSLLKLMSVESVMPSNHLILV